MQNIVVAPIGVVHSAIAANKEEFWGDSQATIELDAARFGPEALAGLSEYSHVEVLFFFNNLREDQVTTGTRHPRNNPAWPKVGIFAQRGKARPNRVGATICRLVNVEGLNVKVCGLDAFDGTPVLDIKPVIAEFIPDSANIRQPAWSHELMRNYFGRDGADL